MKSRGLLVVLMVSVWAVFLGGCQRNWMRNEIKGHKVNALTYPRADMTVGSLGWGDPRKEVHSSRAADDVLSDSFLAGIDEIPIAWKNRKQGYDMFLDVEGSPGPEILRNVQLIGASAGVELGRDRLKFLEWGDLREQNLDLQRLSNAVVRGWFNLPGESFSPEGLMALRPHESHYEHRPWIVRRSIATKGLRYGVDGSVTARLKAKGNVPTYGSAGVKTGIHVKDTETIEVRHPMALGITAWRLVDVQPPLPTAAAMRGGMRDGEYTLTWQEVPPSRKYPPISFVVRTRELREFAAWHAAEQELPAPTVARLETELRKAEPAAMALRAEAVRPLTQEEVAAGMQPKWRTLHDGDRFASDELVRLCVTLREPAYLHILAKDNTGKAAVLFPEVAGERLSRGTVHLIREGDWLFPGNVGGIEGDGMSFKPNDPPGVESFVVIASKDPSPALVDALAEFAREARAKAAAPATTPTRLAEGGLALTGLTRLPDDYRFTGGGSGTVQPRITQAPVEQVAFTGVGNATVLTINLNRVAPGQ
ncbi:MAG: DUF4384 domain-containing protein [Candidatus Sumerlaeia bacterium]|nr:DUF4384 domain-containing protein [Candidatus Sumerlaeia bacterium]